MNTHLRSLAALPWLVCGLATQAATYTWTGAGFLGSKDQLWSNRFNWAGNVPIPVVLNQGPSPLEGAFDSLPEGAPYPIGATVWRIPYIGGTGGDVMLQPDASAPAQFSQPKVLADGTIELHAVTDPDTEYDIEVTAELGAPRSWTRIHTVRSSAAGEVRFSDPDAPLAPSGPLLPVPQPDPCNREGSGGAADSFAGRGVSEARIPEPIRNERTTKALRKKIQPTRPIRLHGSGSEPVRKLGGALRRGILAVAKAVRPAHPRPGCNGRANAGHRQKDRRPEGFLANSTLASLLVGHPARRDSLLAPRHRAVCQETGPLGVFGQALKRTR